MKKRKNKSVKKEEKRFVDLWMCSSCGVIVGKVVNRCPVCKVSSAAFIKITK